MAKKLPATRSRKKSQAPTKAATPLPVASDSEETLQAGKAEPQRVKLSEAAGMPVTSEADLAVIRARIAATEKRLSAESGIVWEGWHPEGPVEYVVAPLPEPDSPLAFPVELRFFAQALWTRWDRPNLNAVQRYRYTANGRFPVEPDPVEVHAGPPILGFTANEQFPDEPTPGPRRSAGQRRSDASLELEALIAQWATLKPIVSPELAALVDASLKATKGLLGRRQVPDDRLRSTVDDLIDVAEQLEFELEHQAVLSEPVADGPPLPDGPCDPFTWRLNGRPIEDKLQPAAWKMIDHLWTLPDKFASFDDLIVPTYDDHDHVADRIAFGSLRRAGNAFFKKHGIPQRVSLKGPGVLLKSP